MLKHIIIVEIFVKIPNIYKIQNFNDGWNFTQSLKF